VAPLPTTSPPPPATTVSVATGQRDEQFPAISGADYADSPALDLWGIDGGDKVVTRALESHVSPTVS
jgi:hypothetical protein